MMKGNSYRKIRSLFLILVLLIGIYVFNPYKLEYFGYQHKVMAHRVNSIEKLVYTQKFYSGVELDLVYNANSKLFDINHPPAVSIGLELESYLSHIHNKDLKLWLDLKNLSSENAESAASALNQQIVCYGIQKEYVLVESPEVEQLQFFKRYGFKTSFYLPYFLYEQDEVTLKKTIDSLKSLQAKYPTDGISADVANYDILSRYFKNDRKYLWDLHPAYTRRQVHHYNNFRKYVSDPTVEIVLIRVALSVGNR